MLNITLKDVIACTGGKLLLGDPETPLKNLTTDSRSIPEDALFVPIVGASFDGHDYAVSALRDGAAACLTAKREVFYEWERSHPGSRKGIVLVSDTTKAVQAVGRLARSRVHIPAVGVTGSVGKTTTREMIAAALSAEKKVFKTGKNYNNWLGVPLTLSEMTGDDDIAVLELGMNVPGELGTIAALTDLSVAVITNIGVAHIEYYGTQDRICQEKMTVTKGFWPGDPGSKLLILNADDTYLMAHKDDTGFPYVTYGTSLTADYRAANIEAVEEGMRFDLFMKGRKPLPVTISVRGEHNVLNAAAALAVSDRFGIDLQKAAEALTAYKGFANRLQPFEHDGVLYIDDTYNASPASMKAGLEVLSQTNYGNGENRRIAVLGDMFELGQQAPKYHYEVGTYAAKTRLDRLYLLGDLAKQIGKAMDDWFSDVPVLYFDNKDDLVAALREELRPGDIVYLKASHGMKLHEVTEGLIHG